MALTTEINHKMINNAAVETSSFCTRRDTECIINICLFPHYVNRKHTTTAKQLQFFSCRGLFTVLKTQV